MPERARPFVSIVLPCRNERQFIAACLDSVLATAYPTDRLEVLVVDGLSEDGTPAIVADYAARAPFLRLLHNPQRIVPAALNIGIAAARGDVIVRMDAHVTYPPEYVPTLVAELEWTGADNVGGVVITHPGANTAVARAIAAGLSHPLGVGNAYFRIGTDRRRWVDTVPFGCYRREVFDRLGGFDEELARNEDDEFNSRLINRGGRVLLLPNVSSRYFARAKFGPLARMFYQYGYYKPIVARKVGRVMTTRQLVPPVSIAIAAFAGLLGIWSPLALAGSLALIGAYGLLVAGCAVPIARRAGWRSGVAFLAVPPLIHVCYGVGYLKSIVDHALVLAPPVAPTSRVISRSPRAARSGGDDRPELSIVIPCREEVRHIARCLDSILASQFPKDRLEVLVVDGRSTDGTREIVGEYAARHPQVRLLDNPAQITPSALNAGVRAARGEVIMRLDAHSTYPKDYIPRLLAALRETGADNVGGRFETIPADDSAVARAIALGMSHPLGVGNSYFRIGAPAPCWVDTVPFGCYPREVFDRIGLFDEELVRNQDDEFNARLRKHGGRVLLVPTVTCGYSARRSLRQLGRMFYQYGQFKPLVAWKTGRIMTLRQLVPALFVVTLALGAATSVERPDLGLAAAALAGLYGVVVLATAVAAMPARGWRCALVLTAVFPVMHFSYGVGFLAGLRRLFRSTGNSAEARAAIPLSR